MEEKAKKNGNTPINGVSVSEGILEPGLTKREYFAGLAMQGLCVSHYFHEDVMPRIAELSVKMAEDLLDKLSENGK